MGNTCAIAESKSCTSLPHPRLRVTKLQPRENEAKMWKVRGEGRKEGREREGGREEESNEKREKKKSCFLKLQSL